MFNHLNKTLAILNNNSTTQWVPVEDNIFYSYHQDSTVYIEIHSAYDATIYGYSEKHMKNTFHKNFYNYHNEENNIVSLVNNILKWLNAKKV